MSANSNKIEFIERGKGTPLVFIHGSLSDYRSWALQIQSFSKNFQTIAVSLPNMYPKPLEREKNLAVILQHADDLLSFIKDLKKGPVHLVGHSRGGALALILAAGHPDLFQSVVLADPAPLDALLPKLSKVLVELKKRNTFIIEAVDHIEKGDLDKGLELFTDAVSNKDTWKKLPEIGKQIRRENALSLKSLILDGKALFTVKDAMNIDMPVLLLTGEKSPCLYGMMHTALESRLCNFKKIIISKASHGMHRDNPDEFNTIVFDFLMKHNNPKKQI
ncbi:MAG: alpha/beta hydrolase [Desulfobacula sp.]|uniref:alpha/beta fold hydrolase n=1 Tax=Desulfobacula sp. TaxID=2593537 RepID=UPI001DCB7A40|nr:alpha/beta hydrolase [Desulfobacula sp.]MBT3485495.1 alpha/beta hydrolase [Desulfobacula sp.]MBT3804843.1 alpha/beta hydrolase [Desulfobacula sp.]MBT4027453.1 alpha/beta hydrolase [Desulfobacula sp.]MBT4201253.1 alpha/beta hydrolase [Desulfobacula sp.]